MKRVALLLTVAIAACIFGQVPQSKAVPPIPNHGETFPTLLHRAAIAYGVDVNQGAISPSVFTQKYTEKEFTGSFEEVLQRLVNESIIKIRFRKDGDKYVIEYSEPLLYNVETHRKKTREVLGQIFKAWKQEYRLEINGNPEGPTMGWENMYVSASVVLSRYLSACRPELQDEVDPNGVHVISPKTDIGLPATVSKSGHKGPVIQCEFSSDGKLAATMGEDGYINVWDVATGTNAGPTQAGLLAEHGLMTHDGRLIYASGNSVYISKVGTGERVHIYQVSSQITALAFARDREWVAIGDAKGRLSVIKVNEESSSAELVGNMIEGEGGYIHFLSLSENGNNLAFVNGRGNQPDREVIWVHIDHKHWDPPRRLARGRIVQLALNRQGDCLACCTQEGDLSYWKTGDMAGKAPKAHYEDRQARVRFAFTPDGYGIVYSFLNEAMRTENVLTGAGSDYAPKSKISFSVKKTGARQRPGYDWNLTAMAYSPKDQVILLGTDAPDSEPTKVFAYDAISKKVVRSFEHKSNQVASVQFSRDGKLLLVQDFNGLHIWRPSMEALPESIRAGTLSLQPKKSEGDSGLLAVGSDPIDGSLKYWAAETGAKCEVNATHKFGTLDQVTWSGDGQFFLTHDYRGEIALWPVKLGPNYSLSPKWILPGVYAHLAGFCLNFDGTRVAVAQGGDEGFFRIYDTTTQTLVKEIKNDPKVKDHPNIAGPLECSSASQSDVMFFQDGESTVVIRPSSGAIMQEFRGKHPSLSPGGRYLAIEEEDAVRLRDLGQQGQPVLPPMVHRYFPKISSDGTHLFCFSQNRDSVLIVDLKAKEALSLDGLRSLITSVDVMPGTGIIALGRADGKISLVSPKKQHLADFEALGRDDYIATSGHYYMGTPDAARLRTLIDDKGAASAWDQWDLLLNRPDLVMRSIGLATKDAIALTERTYDTRLTQLHFDPTTFKKIAGDAEKLRLPLVKIDTQIKGNQVVVTAEATDRKEVIRSLYVTVNGIPVGEIDTSGDHSQKVTRTFKPVELCTLPQMNENTIRVSAVNALGIEGRASVQISAPITPSAKPDLYVVAVGVKNYQDPNLETLTYPEADALEIVNVFKTLAVAKTRKVALPRSKRKNRGKATYQEVVDAPATFAAVHPMTVLGSEATRENLLKIRDYLATNTKIGDMVVLFFSGHGEAPKDTYYFVTPDATAQNLKQRGFSYADIDHLFDGVAARQRLVLLDTCHSGESENTNRPREIDDQNPPKGKKAKGKVFVRASGEFELMQELFSNLEVGSGASIISASTGNGAAYEDPAINHGAFTKAIIEGLLELKAKDSDGKVTVTSLKDYVLNRVQALTGGYQKPTMRRQNASFDFVLRGAAN